MAEEATVQNEAAEKPAQQLDQGTYEIIRNRLVGHGRELRSRLDQLNAARKEVFGGISTELIATDRITTEHNCIPRDMIAVGERFLFGYNVHFGLKTEIELSDVFAVYRYDEDRTFHRESLDLINDDAFRKDFKDLYRYYKNTVFAKFFVRGPHLYMKFRIGKDVDDFKAFKWAIRGDALEYLDNRSDHEVRYPPQHEFEWRRVTRDQHQQGAYPHVSIEDKVFVETTGGDLTIKVEDNTDVGEGIYAEPVDDPDQSLDDADYRYAVVGHLILIKVRPYQEQKYRHFIFNSKLQEVVRMDTIENACILLPDEQGIIFSNGYYLSSGQWQTFPNAPADVVFERRIAAPNGEDYLYVFYNRQAGIYALLSYNVIEQHVDTPTICNGYSIFENGEMVYFKAQDEPQRHHALQIWRTPFAGPNFVVEGDRDSMLYKIGNRDIVRAMAECVELLTLVNKEDTYAGLYVDIVTQAGDVLDSFFWLDKEEAFNLSETLRAIKEAGQAAVGEFEKVTRIRRSTQEQVRAVTAKAEGILKGNATRIYDNIQSFVDALSSLRSVRGEIIGLRELRYVDAEHVDKLEGEVEEQAESLSRRTVEFLLKPESLTPYHAAAEKHAGAIDGLQKVADAKELDERIGKSSDELEMLIDIVSNLKIDDATQRTAIIDGISAVFSKLNAARTKLKNKRKELARVEGVAEFNSQLKLLNQSVVNYLDVCDTPEKTDEYMTKVMVQLEELEGRFAEFDEFIEQLAEKRDEVYNAFENRKIQLVEGRNKRANALANAADRILKGIKGRVDNMDDVNAINGYFASDLMIEKVRDITRELESIGESVKVDDIQSRLKTIREDAVRQLKDKQELFVEGQNIIRFGKHQFSVNTQTIDLTTVMRNGKMQLHLSGTAFFEAITDEAFNATRDVWDRETVSESDEVYRAEYLAYLIFEALGREDVGDEAGVPDVAEMARMSDEDLLAFVQRFMAPRYSEGYTKGVHDVDAAIIVRALVELHTTIGLLRYPSRPRAVAQLFWQTLSDKRRKTLIEGRMEGYGTIMSVFAEAEEQRDYIADLAGDIQRFTEANPIFDDALAPIAAAYLFHELVNEEEPFVASPEAARLHDDFQGHIKRNRALARYEQSIAGVKQDAMTLFMLLRDWARAFLEGSPDHDTSKFLPYLDETAMLLFTGQRDQARVINTSVRRELDGLAGSHERLQDGKLTLDYNEFMTRLHRFATVEAPKFEQFTEMKKQIVESTREGMRLDEFKPRVLTSFVRNRLIDKTYLPLIGDNLSKQIGTAGESKRTDRQGLLLLISPPGYGKTTLMEYIANRLGIVFMKINGPAIGHGVTSLDPSEAPNAAAREELNKLNLALEMGDNVMIYLDDIQHTNSELLQKFISLCDATRRIEGVYKGKPRTYDLRGRKVAVVMAGNPYTESGEKFQIPDMLANRADTYNLGDIIGEHGDAFKMSYLENALTSNPTLNKLASRSQKDVYSVIKIAETGRREGVEFEAAFSTEEINEMVAAMKKLMRVRDVILTVNQEYIRSAGMEDQYREEPPFQLQGSYRNMNRIAERVVPIMNDEELQTLIISSYEQDAQTLTTGAEANLLKFREMLGILTEDEAKRWAEIKRTFARNNAVRALGGDDRTAQVLTQMAGFNQNLEDIREAIGAGVASMLEAGEKEENEEEGSAKPQAAEVWEPVLAKAGEFVEVMGALRDVVKEGVEKVAKPQATAKKKGRKGDGKPQAVEAKLDKGTLDAIGALTEQFKALAEGLPGAMASAVVSEGGAEVEVRREGAGSAKPRAASGEGGGEVRGGEPYEIKVVNKIPSTFLYVMKEQFNLMKGWMEPLTRITADQEDQLKQLGATLDSLAKRYDDMIQRLEQSSGEEGQLDE